VPWPGVLREKKRTVLIRHVKKKGGLDPESHKSELKRENHKDGGRRCPSKRSEKKGARIKRPFFVGGNASAGEEVQQGTLNTCRKFQILLLLHEPKTDLGKGKEHKGICDLKKIRTSINKGTKKGSWRRRLEGPGVSRPSESRLGKEKET